MEPFPGGAPCIAEKAVIKGPALPCTVTPLTGSRVGVVSREGGRWETVPSSRRSVSESFICLQEWLVRLPEPVGQATPAEQTPGLGRGGGLPGLRRATTRAKPTRLPCARAGWGASAIPVPLAAGGRPLLAGGGGTCTRQSSRLR